MPPPSLRDLVRFLNIFLPASLTLQHGFTIINDGSGASVNKLHGLKHWLNSSQSLSSLMMSLNTGHLQLLDIGAIYDALGVGEGLTDPLSVLPKPWPLLCTARLCCIFCTQNGAQLHTLRRREKLQEIWFLDADYQWTRAHLVVAHCIACKADFYPDKIVHRDLANTRVQMLEFDSKYIRISKHGVWVHRNLAIAQERSIVRFRAGWSNFALYLNEIIDSKTRKITSRQSQRLFLEHFARRLLRAHGKEASDFLCAPNPNSQDFAKHLRLILGENGGVIPGAMIHGCTECTHRKRYLSDLVEEGAQLDNQVGALAEIPPVENNDELTAGEPQNHNIPAALQNLPRQMETPPDGTPRGYVRMAVMDGKSVGHRIIFTLKTFVASYHAGDQSMNQTVQWACGTPIGWGKCYNSQSSPQVLEILNKIWSDFPTLR
ncbi:hypothetical protein K435DRAFT_813519 [Dendrothele bispora CBS 962.96]|uniref:CxC5 like cysteine cluster associated with KDZ domain-containing protein n=1 Tax=Dendrothele bispora (strain CBS 962.96) TaxID=1314807 RepID=A0A4S8KLC0_DENBC|nr:hypothetical protein K435DRAFT_813519 [Dendrothele bispora CBS 962.96]